MSSSSFDKDMYNTLHETFADYISVVTQIYRLNIFTPIYKDDVSTLAKTIIYLVRKYQIPCISFFQMIDKACSFNRKYTRVYWNLFMKLMDEFKYDKFENFDFSPLFSAFIKYQYNQVTAKFSHEIQNDDEFNRLMEVFKPDTLMHAILYDDVEEFKKHVDYNYLQKFDYDLEDKLRLPWFIPFNSNSISDWVCQLGAKNCFDFCVEKGLTITKDHLNLAFLGGNRFIIDKIIETIGLTNLKDFPIKNVIINHDHGYEMKFWNPFKISFEEISEHHDLLLYIYKLCETKNFNSALLYCVPFGILPFVNYLLDNGADAKSSAGATALYICCKKQNVEMLSLLVSKGANYGVVTVCNLSEAEIARKTHDIDFRNFMLLGGESLLDYCACFDSIDCFKLLSRKLDLHGKNSKGKQTIHIACKYNSDQIVRSLLEKKINVNSLNKGKNTPLHICARYNSFDVCKVLFEYKADVKIVNSKGMTALHKTVKNEAVDVASLLLQKGLNPNTKDSNNLTSLQHAVIKNREKICLLFLTRGGNRNTKDDEGKSLLHLAVKHDSQDVGLMLIEEGLDINVKDNKGITSLMYCAEVGNTSMAKLLLSKGADVNSLNKENQNVLHMCCIYNSFGVLQTCLEKYPHMNVKDKNGKTPLDIAKEKGNQEIIDVLNSYTDPTEINKDGAELEDI
ncbi:hypothetical protein TVAG_016770 [Trichomonas vaginalis G3]|uniref:DUF3447 domain-containing protein n=1 Tax=Trichomonas vaginalis (strain ATCC PRA-98 / G3) TaxID=412133 RepID=A2ER15_TRIV3|nr:spectrin binding [Trichomonas vaginalis G3]EAY04905.1 hypothetical protein TVAG_016770 [Trichomonas vaginalis G3]KAI5519437.1 spectrin binding [Trichomonas vaginalis G3]|eukprot:XP_001317128.1 hypothetical protein [Trichomonas vaginalis G3]